MGDWYSAGRQKPAIGVSKKRENRPSQEGETSNTKGCLRINQWRAPVDRKVVWRHIEKGGVRRVTSEIDKLPIPGRDLPGYPIESTT